MITPKPEHLPKAGPREIATGTTTGKYKPTWAPLRPNADQHEKIPSRHNGSLYYRDGRVEVL